MRSREPLARDGGPASTAVLRNACRSVNNPTVRKQPNENVDTPAGFRGRLYVPAGVNPICCQKTRECVFLGLRGAMRDSLLRKYPDRKA